MTSKDSGASIDRKRASRRARGVWRAAICAFVLACGGSAEPASAQVDNPRHGLKRAEQAETESANRAEEATRRERALEQELQALQLEAAAAAAERQRLEARQAGERTAHALAVGEALRAAARARTSQAQAATAFAALFHIADQNIHTAARYRQDPWQGALAARVLALTAQERAETAARFERDARTSEALGEAVRRREVRITSNLQALERAGVRLDLALERRARLVRAAHGDRREAEAAATHAAQRAENLRELLAHLADGTTLLPRTHAEGRLRAPVSTAAHTGFGEGTGLQTNGLLFLLAPDAVITAPLSGTVAWAGSFRGWGQLLIIAHDRAPAEGGQADTALGDAPQGDAPQAQAPWHSLLSGAEHLEVVVGQRVLSREPVARMGGATRQTLYWELRHDGAPVNPTPLMRAARRAQAEP